MSDLLSASVLVVNQKAKLIEVNNQYLIKDAEGNDLGRIEQEGQSKLKKVVRFLGDVDQFMTHTLGVYDASGNKVLKLTRPRKVFKSRLEVEDGMGRKVGEIVQKNVFGKSNFDFVASDGRTIGHIKAENWRAWNFAIVDETEHEIGRITKKFVGALKGVFTPADNYVVEIQPSATGDLRLFALAAAAGVDTALKQDSRGLDIGDIG
jgi:uncharacterized protein YxjI